MGEAPEIWVIYPRSIASKWQNQDLNTVWLQTSSPHRCSLLPHSSLCRVMVLQSPHSLMPRRKGLMRCAWNGLEAPCNSHCWLLPADSWCSVFWGSLALCIAGANLPFPHEMDLVVLLCTHIAASRIRHESLVVESFEHSLSFAYDGINTAGWCVSFGQFLLGWCVVWCVSTMPRSRMSPSSVTAHEPINWAVRMAAGFLSSPGSPTACGFSTVSTSQYNVLPWMGAGN